MHQVANTTVSNDIGIEAQTTNETERKIIPCNDDEKINIDTHDTLYARENDKTCGNDKLPRCSLPAVKSIRCKSTFTNTVIAATIER